MTKRYSPGTRRHCLSYSRNVVRQFESLSLRHISSPSSSRCQTRCADRTTRRQESEGTFKKGIGKADERVANVASRRIAHALTEPKSRIHYLERRKLCSYPNPRFTNWLFHPSRNNISMIFSGSTFRMFFQSWLNMPADLVQPSYGSISTAPSCRGLTVRR